MLKCFWYVFYTECLLGMRRSKDWLFPVCFFVIVISLFPLAFTPDATLLEKFFPGFIWLAALFASLLSASAIFSADVEDSHLEQMLLSEIPLSLLMTSKLAAYWCMSMLPLILLTPLLSLLFNINGFAMLVLCLGLLAGTPALLFLNSFGTALTLGLKQQGVVMGLLILPLTIPILIFGVSIVLQAQANINFMGGLMLLISFSLTAVLFLPLAIAGVLRAGFDD